MTPDPVSPDTDEQSSDSPISPTSVSFADADAAMGGPVIGPMVVPSREAGVDEDDVEIAPFESADAVRRWAHQAALGERMIQNNEAVEPVVAIQELADGWIVAVHALAR